MLTRSAHSPAIRRGLAPLEFVMVLPLLVAATLLILTIGKAGLVKSDAILNARNRAWLTATPPTQHALASWGPHPTAPLQDGPYPGVSPVKSSKPFSPPFTRASLLRNFPVPKTMTASLAVLHGSWDHETIPFTSDGALIPNSLLVDLVGGEIDALQEFHDLEALVNAVPALGKTLPSSISVKVVDDLVKLIDDIKHAKEDIEKIQKDLNDLLNKGGSSGGGGLGGGSVPLPGGGGSGPLPGGGGGGNPIPKLGGGLNLTGNGVTDTLKKGATDLLGGKAPSNPLQGAKQILTADDVAQLVRDLTKAINDNKDMFDHLKAITQQVGPYLTSQLKKPPLNVNDLNPTKVLQDVVKAIGNGTLQDKLNELKTVAEDTASFPLLLLELFDIPGEFSDF